ncbi:DUF6153 family protein [Agromyces mediolanus]|uniref:DUF6153 family protein n=1 Tax=Agromyces mediolanus TaxID=41986 RepID=UPI00203D1E69|nr:DUF6153 family protein [Agromyces mediolanus]MCM3655990.1 DUF6153 family protein [Agromyces mediolanus]
MNHIRTLVHAPSGLHRLLLTFATALLLIAGLLAMHTLTGTLTSGHADTPAAASEAAHAAPDSDLGGTVATGSMLENTIGTGTEASGGHCEGDCDSSGGMPDHSMLMMACLLALLAATIVLLAPALLARLGTVLALLRLHGRNVLTALPHPRPPSLIVLSISRT